MSDREMMQILAAHEASISKAVVLTVQANLKEVERMLESIQWQQGETQATLEQMIGHITRLATTPDELRSELKGQVRSVTEIHLLQMIIAEKVRELTSSQRHLLKQKDQELILIEKVEASLRDMVNQCLEMMATNICITGEYASAMRNQLSDHLASAVELLQSETQKINQLYRRQQTSMRMRLITIAAVALMGASFGGLTAGKIVSDMHSHQVEQAINQSFIEMRQCSEDSQTLNYLLSKIPSDRREDFLTKLKLEMRLGDKDGTANPQNPANPSKSLK